MAAGGPLVGGQCGQRLSVFEEACDDIPREVSRTRQSNAGGRAVPPGGPVAAERAAPACPVAHTSR